MKIGLFLLLLAASSLAQDPADARIDASCGPNGMNFEMKPAKNPQPPPPLSAGQARVYVLQDDDSFQSVTKPTTRVGLDGQWVGATHGDSYVYFPVDPGEHHVCASWQAWGNLKAGDKTLTLTLKTVAGRVYYCRVKDVYRPDHVPPTPKLETLDFDAGHILAETFSLSLFQPLQKK